MKQHIPNLLTLLNLAAGTSALVLALEGHWHLAVWLVLAGAAFDFLDGLAARLLNANSESGKQLDALADVVTFGVVPGVFVYLIFRDLFVGQAPSGPLAGQTMQWIILGSVVVIPVLSAVRLARFNVSGGDADYFRGLPTPAHALFWTGIFRQVMPEGLLFGTGINAYFLWAIMWIMALHMVLPVPMLTLKFRDFSLKSNPARYLLIGVGALILVLTGIPGLSLAVLAYILISLLNFLLLSRVSR